MKPQRRPLLQIGVPLTVLALMTFGASIMRAQTEVTQSEAAGPLVRWDILHFTFTPPTADAGGSASAKASDDSRITVTGSGTFLASGESFQAVTGGGTWTTYAPNGTTVTDSGTYIVTELVRWELAPGSLPAAVVDRIGSNADAHSGLAILRIRYSDGSQGVLTVSCHLPVGSPDTIFEGIIASKGFTSFWNNLAPAAGVDANRTVFHISGPAPTTGCSANATTLCLGGGRFQVGATFQAPNGTSGPARAILVTPDSGDFYFFTPNNIDLSVKVVDGRAYNNRFWVFIGSLTNVQYTVTVTDTVTGVTKTYSNSQNSVGCIADTESF